MLGGRCGDKGPGRMGEGTVVGGDTCISRMSRECFKALWIRKGRAAKKAKEISLAILSNFYSVVCQVFYVHRVLNTLKNEEK